MMLSPMTWPWHCQALLLVHTKTHQILSFPKHAAMLERDLRKIYGKQNEAETELLVAHDLGA